MDGVNKWQHSVIGEYYTHKTIESGEIGCNLERILVAFLPTCDVHPFSPILI